MPFIQILLILIGMLLVADTLFVLQKVNFNAGVIMPAILGLPLLIWGLFFPSLQRLSGHALVSMLQWLLVIGYGLFILTFGWILVQIVSAEHRPLLPDTADTAVLLVLGASLYGSQVSRTLALRLDAALSILRARPDLPVIVSGGQGPGEAVPEAAAMERYLIDRGIRQTRIFVEDRSINTTENFSRSLPLIRQATRQNDPLIVVVTSGFHLYRALLIAGRQGFRASGISAPNLWYLVPNNLLREYLAIFKYHLLGY